MSVPTPEHGQLTVRQVVQALTAGPEEGALTGLGRALAERAQLLGGDPDLAHVTIGRLTLDQLQRERLHLEAAKRLLQGDGLDLRAAASSAGDGVVLYLYEPPSTPERQDPVTTPRSGLGAAYATPVPAPCPDCQGEGAYLTVGGPGRFDDRLECWMPSEDWHPCPSCHGQGVLPPPEDRHEPEPTTGQAPAEGARTDREDAELPF